MPLPHRRTLVLYDGVVLEPIPELDRLVLWVSTGGDQRFRYWERIATVPRASIRVEDGLCFTAATVIPCRQRISTGLNKLLSGLRKRTTNQTWVMPNGEAVEQVGDRRNDALLVWSEEDGILVDEVKIRSGWPQSQRRQRLAKNLFLVTGVGLDQASKDTEPAPPPVSVPATAVPFGPPLQTPTAPLPPQVGAGDAAKQWLLTARQQGDRHQELTALADLGVFALREGDVHQAKTILTEALALARQLGDRAREGDVLGHLGLATLSTGDFPKARELVEQELVQARAGNDRFALKAALDHLGIVRMVLRDHGGALAVALEALALAREVGDRPQQADLLWLVAVQHAELGQREQAISHGQAAVDLYQRMGRPEAGTYAEYLEKYRQAETASSLSGSPTASFGGSIGTSAWTAIPNVPAAPDQLTNGPGLLRMAVAAGAAAVKYLSSGMKTVSAEHFQRRVGTCAGCEHHTGLRCRLCGCFTKAKAWLPHEDCPLGKWPQS
jgi:tetratricopeptide (TPR) repeat protein